MPPARPPANTGSLASAPLAVSPPRSWAGSGVLGFAITPKAVCPEAADGSAAGSRPALATTRDCARCSRARASSSTPLSAPRLTSQLNPAPFGASASSSFPPIYPSASKTSVVSGAALRASPPSTDGAAPLTRSPYAQSDAVSANSSADAACSATLASCNTRPRAPPSNCAFFSATGAACSTASSSLAVRIPPVGKVCSFTSNAPNTRNTAAAANAGHTARRVSRRRINRTGSG